MATKISSRKAKARRLQNWVAQKISEVTGIEWGKDKLITPREMGQAGTDVRLIGPAKEDFCFSVECKNQESWSVHSWIKQAKGNLGDFDTWLLFCDKNRSEEKILIMDAEKFFELYKELLELRRND